MLGPGGMAGGARARVAAWVAAAAQEGTARERDKEKVFACLLLDSFDYISLRIYSPDGS